MTTLAVPYFMGQPFEGLAVPEPHETLAPDLPEGSPQERMAALNWGLAEWVAAQAQPVVYAGDCVAIIGVLAGLQHRRLHPTLVFFDAHGDFHTWETTGSQFIGGMPLAMVTGRGEQTIVAGAGAKPLADSDVLLVDARDLDPGEDEAVAASGVRVVTVNAVPSAVPADRPVYVHVDVDVVDPEDMPAVNYPAPAGPSLAEVRAALLALAATGRVVAFSISTWNPALPGAEQAAVATVTLAAPFLE